MRSNIKIKKLNVLEDPYTGTSGKKNYGIYTVILTCDDGSEVVVKVYSDDQVTSLLDKCVELDGEDIRCVASIVITAREHGGRYYNDISLRKLQSYEEADADAARLENIHARLVAKKAQKAAASKPAGQAVAPVPTPFNQPKPNDTNPFTGEPCYTPGFDNTFEEIG